MNKLHLIQLKHFPIFQQLQVEEALLRNDTRNWCVINHGTPPAIVMGISGKTELMLSAKCFMQKNIPIIRRFSGGGTVFVDEDTHFVTLIFNSGDLNIPCCPQKIMEWTHQIYQPVFADLDFKIRENDYVIENKKFGGNAQYMRKNRWLHHSSLLWDFDPSNMEYLAIPPRMPIYREKRSHTDFLCRLRDYYSSRNVLENKIVKELERQFEIITVSLEHVQEILEEPHRKATTSIEI